MEDAIFNRNAACKVCQADSKQKTTDLKIPLFYNEFLQYITGKMTGN
jgi:hypothetical protein